MNIANFMQLQDFRQKFERECFVKTRVVTPYTLHIYNVLVLKDIHYST